MFQIDIICGAPSNMNSMDSEYIPDIIDVEIGACYFPRGPTYCKSKLHPPCKCLRNSVGIIVPKKVKRAKLEMKLGALSFMSYRF